MKRFSLINILLAVLIITCSCSNKETEAFFAGHYALPKIMMKIQDGEAVYEKTPSDTALYVVWYSRDDCTECAVKHLEERFGYLWRLQSKVGNFHPMIIMSPLEENQEQIVELIKAYAFPWPVYLDLNNECAEALPANPKFHYFLMNGEGKPVWLGSPIKDGLIDENFLKKTECL